MNVKLALKTAAVAAALTFAVLPAVLADDDSDTDELEDEAIQNDDEQNVADDADVAANADDEINVPLEETPDPDEEGISDEEREERLKLREEALQRQQAEIARIRAEREQGAFNLEEQRRIAALNKEMFEYLQEDKWDLAMDALKEGADVNAKDEKGRTPAFYCVEKGKYNILTSLDESPDGTERRKVDLNAQDNSGMSLLHCAVKNKQDAIVTYLVRVRACTPKTQMKNGTSPLFDAAKTGTAEQVTLLLTFGADPNAATTAGLTPLHQAAARGNLDMVKELVQAGAEVNAMAKNGRTPIFYAAARGKATTVSYLLDKKAEINLADEDGMTPLILAAGSGNTALVKHLVLNKKANFAATAKDGTTALIAGAKTPEIVKFLAEKMPNVNGVDKDGNSVLHLCAATADEETVRKLLYHGAKEDLPNKKGETPILLAARAGNVEMVKRLLNMNVKVTKEIVDAAKTKEIKDLLSEKLK